MKEVVQSFIELNELCITVPPQPTTAVPQYSAVPRRVPPEPTWPTRSQLSHARLPPTAHVGRCTHSHSKGRIAGRLSVEQSQVSLGVCPSIGIAAWLTLSRAARVLNQSTECSQATYPPCVVSASDCRR